METDEVRDAVPTLCDVLRLPREVGAPCGAADILACALASRRTCEALREACGGALPPPSLQVLIRNVKRFQWAVETLGMPVATDVLAVVAAGEGALDTLQWLAAGDDGCTSRGQHSSVSWGVGVCREAARGGHIHVLRYARLLLKCPWDASVCANAAASGHLEVLQWLREHGCPFDKMCPAWAEVNGHAAVKDWAIANGCDYSAELVVRLRMARVMSMRDDGPADEQRFHSAWAGRIEQ